ncbi:MAG: DUF58 domain-containing protein [Deltaproteobacteria bacterium]|nr:DUF58 domain-containing protein [Deltaproteobacteria bacterium]
MDDLSSFFTPEFLARISRVSLFAGKLVGGGRPSDRTSKRTGTGTEFADHREYIHGDDPKQIDWRLYGRTGKFFTKLYHSEEDRIVTIALDCSSSMSAGRDKFDLARRLAGALVFLATKDRDTAVIAPFDEKVRNPLHGLRGEPGFRRSLGWLSGLDAKGHTDLPGVAGNLLGLVKSRGPIILISDLMDSRTQSAGFLSSLTGKHGEAVIIHVFAPTDREPQIRGYVRIMDVEDNNSIPVLLDSRLAKRYTETFDMFRKSMKARCRSLGIRYVSISSDKDLAEVFLKEFREAGITC